MTELVTHYRNENWTTSMIIAKELKKNHKHVMERIRKILDDDEKSRVENSTVNHDEKYVLSTYTNDMGREYSMYKLNKSAFSFLLMQLSGKKVRAVQRDFIKAFYDMEQHILKLENSRFVAVREQGKIARSQVTDSIRGLVEHATSQGSKNAKFYYSTITKETYKALGFLASGEKVGSDFRNHLDGFQLSELFIAESLATKVIENGIEDGLHYKEIYLLAKQKVCNFGESQSLLRLK